MSVSELQTPSTKIREICRRYLVTELSLFGSTARNEDSRDSDLDLLVEFSPNARIGLIQFASLTEDLAAAFGRGVDLVPKQGLKPMIRDSVLRDAKILYAA